MLRPFLRERGSTGEQGGTEEAVSPVLDPQQILERWELAQSVHAAIAALPQPYREVLVLRDLEGLSGEETCQALGLEPAAMKTRLHRARQRVRELMKARRSDGARVQPERRWRQHHRHRLQRSDRVRGLGRHHRLPGG